MSFKVQSFAASAGYGNVSIREPGQLIGLRVAGSPVNGMTFTVFGVEEDSGSFVNREIAIFAPNSEFDMQYSEFIAMNTAPNGVIWSLFAKPLV